MARSGSSLRVFAWAILAAILALPLPAKTPLTDVPLAWSPTRTISESGLTAVNLVPFQGKSIQLAAFTDARAEPAFIGENRENPAKPLRVTTRDAVADWVTAQTQRFLADLGLPMVEAGATTVVTGQVARFFVAEGENYLGDVRLKVQVQVAGKVVWSGMAIGAARRFGRSYKLDNYQETLSDSLQEAWVSLARSSEFLAAMSQ